MFTFTSVFGSLLQSLRPAAGEEPGLPGPERADLIRHAMLDALAGAGDERSTALARRIRLSHDVQALWYLRPELMATLATVHGEAVARRTLSRITGLFSGGLPQGLRQQLALRG